MANFNKQIRLLLNIKPAEIPLVKQLFLIQFLLGIATAFLFISSLTLFLSTFDSRRFPQAYVGAAVLLLLANILYARLEKRYPPNKLLLVVILFSVVSIFCTWLGAYFFTWPWLPFFLAAWNLVVYMLVGYAFWGMAAVLFNVRESKRLFTVVGSGDIPAKMLGYGAVALLVPLIGVANLLWISIAAFLIAYYLLHSYKNLTTHLSHHDDDHAHHHIHRTENFAYVFLKQLFEHRLIFFISLWSVVAFTVYAFIDFTFLIEIKARYTQEHELAAFVGIFFTLGRFLALLFKLFLSSRLITRLGLANALFISPLLLLGLTGYILIKGPALHSPLYVFGVMVLVSEILKSVVQEPVFFVLFQPLNPHLRLKGHLIAKGYTLPFALLGSGLFLAWYLQKHAHIPIALIAQALAGLIGLWIITILLIKKEYLATLLKAIQKGYFTGTELFLNDHALRDLLIQKTKSGNTNEVIYALDLLERSDYNQIQDLWLQLLPAAPVQVKTFILTRLIDQKVTEAFPLIQEMLLNQPAPPLRHMLIKAFYVLQPVFEPQQETDYRQLDEDEKKAALTGMLNQKESPAEKFAREELTALAHEPEIEKKIFVGAVIAETPGTRFTPLLAQLLDLNDPNVLRSALLAIGKTQDFSLIPKAIPKIGQHNLYTDWQKTIILAGDEIFNSDYFKNTKFPPPVEKINILAAGKLKGENSDAYLLDLLTAKSHYTSVVLEALWFKKAALPPEKYKLLEAYLKDQLDKTRVKIYYHQSLPEKPYALLISAFKSEIEQDLQKILKGFALRYNRKTLNRVIHLYRFGDKGSFSNAVEMLEMVIPKRFFQKTDALLEFLSDVKRKKEVDIILKKAEPAVIFEDLLTQNEASCNAWTISVAYYLLPELTFAPFLKKLVLKTKLKPETEEPLIKETREYALNGIA